LDLTCTFDASGSTDDHDIASYGWTFGDGATGSGVTASHTFASAGTYTVTLLVRDTIGQSATLAKDVAVAAGARAVHLASAIGSSTTRKSGWTATVVVSVHDATNSPVGGATVIGTWSTGGTGTCVTTAAGSCTFSTNVSRKSASVTWTVSSIAAAGSAYDPSANQGSSVTIAAP
jgi:PKD repeat protein